MTYPVTGHTTDLPQQERDTNELETLIKFTEQQPNNLYWRMRLQAVVDRIETDRRQADKAAQDEALAHIDELAGEERFATMQMIDGVELFAANTYDCTPCEAMPVIDFENIKEVKF